MAVSIKKFNRLTKVKGTSTGPKQNYQSDSESDPEDSFSDDDSSKENEHSPDKTRITSTHQTSDQESLSVNDDSNPEDIVIKNQDNCSENDDSRSESESIPEASGNPGWADAMSKVLYKKSDKDKPLILSRAKLDRDVKKVPEKDTEETTILDPKSKKRKMEDEENASKRRVFSWENIGRTKPNILDREKERALVRVATKGVVQLFNAVQHQQNNIEERVKEAKGSVRREERVMKTVDKGQFLDLLHSKKVKIGSDTEENNDRSVCNILRDDFMLDGGKMKDWDKESDSD